jgi:tRNA pseudouridine38-40 synthase
VPETPSRLGERLVREETSTTYRAVVEYDGTDFHGFQYQPQIRTVAGELEAALARLFGGPVKVTGAGRTDAGVHASGQVVSFTATRAFRSEKLGLALNANLPPDLSVRGVARAEDGFSARLDALERRYVYVILNRPERSALWRRLAHHDYRRLDLEALRAAAGDLVGTHDFSTFCGTPPENGVGIRTVYGIDAYDEPPFVRLRFRARGFLHRMVRVMTGTLLDIAAGKRAADVIPELLAAADRRFAGLTASPEGLFLTGVRYADFDSNPGDLMYLSR